MSEKRSRVFPRSVSLMPAFFPTKSADRIRTVQFSLVQWFFFSGAISLLYFKPFVLIRLEPLVCTVPQSLTIWVDESLPDSWPLPRCCIVKQHILWLPFLWPLHKQWPIDLRRQFQGILPTSLPMLDWKRGTGGGASKEDLTFWLEEKWRLYKGK